MPQKKTQPPQTTPPGEQPDRSTLDELEGEPVLQVVLVDGKLVETWVPAKAKKST
jgi:hypothetical protein